MPQIVDVNVRPAEDRPGAIPGVAAGVVIRQPEAQQLLRDGERLGLQRDDVQPFLLGVRGRLDPDPARGVELVGARLKTSPMRQPVSSASRSASAAARLLSWSRAACAALISSASRKTCRWFSGRRFTPLAGLRSILRSCSSQLRNAHSTASARLASIGVRWAISPCQCSMALRAIARGSLLPKAGRMWLSIRRL